MLKTTFSKHRLIKIRITCVYIKPGIKKKNGTTAMTTNKATNKACIG